MTKDEVFGTLVELGVGKVRVTFSGGNDEGGVDNITLISATDASKNVDVSMWSRDPDLDPRVTDELIKALGEPVYGRYSTFAGEFTVYGVVTWDVPSRRCFFEGQESTYVPLDEPDW